MPVIFRYKYPHSFSIELLNLIIKMGFPLFWSLLNVHELSRVICWVLLKKCNFSPICLILPRVVGIVAVILLLIAAVLVLAGVNNIAGLPMFSAGDFASGYLSAGQFSIGVFSSGTFAAGIFAIGIFSIGIFSIGIFSIGIFSFGIYALGIYVARRYIMPSEKKEENE